MVGQVRTLGVHSYLCRTQAVTIASVKPETEKQNEKRITSGGGMFLCFKFVTRFCMIMFASGSYYLTVHFVSWHWHGEVSGRSARHLKSSTAPICPLNFSIDRQTYTMTSDTGAVHAPLHLDSGSVTRCSPPRPCRRQATKIRGAYLKYR